LKIQNILKVVEKEEVLHILGFSLYFQMQIFLVEFLYDANDANDLNYKHGLLQNCGE
jgi:hypothetical protein